MEFLLKKFVLIFLMPLSIVFILLVLGLVYLMLTNGKKGKGFISFGLALLFLISYEPFANAISKPLESKYKAYLDIDKSIKYVVVLGSRHTTNQDISNVSMLTSSALFRLSEGIRIFKALDSATLITSGYAGLKDTTSHAIIVKNAAISLGVDENSIISQPDPKDTIEEAIAIKELLKDEKFILVTSATHMPRAIKIFNSYSLYPIAAPTDFLVKGESDFFSIPKGSNIEKTKMAVHEYLGSLWHFISTMF